MAFFVYFTWDIGYDNSRSFLVLFGHLTNLYFELFMLSKHLITFCNRSKPYFFLLLPPVVLIFAFLCETYHVLATKKSFQESFNILLVIKWYHYSNNLDSRFSFVLAWLSVSCFMAMSLNCITQCFITILLLLSIRFSNHFHAFFARKFYSSKYTYGCCLYTLWFPSGCYNQL